MQATNTRICKRDGKTYLVLTEAQERALTDHAEQKIKEMFSTWTCPDEFRKILNDNARAIAVEIIECSTSTPID